MSVGKLTVLTSSLAPTCTVYIWPLPQLSVSIERADVDRFIRAYLKTVSHRLSVSLSHANTGKMGFYCNKRFAKRFLE